jgi:hypothetical protein
LGLWSFQITASCTIILCPTLFCQSRAFIGRKLLASADCETRTALFELLALVGLYEFLADLLGYAAEPAFSVSGGLHQSMLSGRFARHSQSGFLISTPLT